MKKIHILFIASAFSCNILSAAAIDHRSFFSAIEENDIEKVQNFLRENKDIDINDEYWYGFPLHFSARKGNVELVRLLLECGVRADTENRMGLTAAEVARFQGHDNIEQLITSWHDDIKEPEGN